MSCDNTLENCFNHISSHTRAYVRIIYEKTKGQIPSDLPDREKKTYKLKRSINAQENTPSLAHLMYIDLP